MTLSKRKIALLAATILALGGTAAAIAQVTGTYDLTQMPAMHGTVAQYDLTPRGDVDGLILQDGTEVHFPPHLGAQVVALVRPGDAVTLHGLKARALPLVQAMSVTADASGKTVADNGPPPGGHRPGHPPASGEAALHATSSVKMQLHGPRGDLNGVLLTDGTIVHLPPREATRLADQLKTGAPVIVNGHGIEGPLGRVINADQIGSTPDKLVTIARPPHPGDQGAPPAPDAPIPEHPPTP